MSGVEWTRGDAALAHEVEASLAHSECLHENARRAIFRVRLPGRSVLVKQFRVGSGRHPLRERWKARIGRAPAEREWRALVALRAAGLPVPAPLALGAQPDGDRLLVLEWIDGVPLAQALLARFARRRAIVTELGALLRRVHEAGFAHGDLHAGNVLVASGGPVLLDWQHAPRHARAAAKRADLAQLEHALAPLVSQGLRLRLRCAALGPEASSEALRAAGRAVRERARAHARARTRRACRPGRTGERVACDGAQGLAARDLAPDALAAILAAHAAACAAGDARVIARSARSVVTGVAAAGRRVVVKETPWRGPARALADALRGSAAARGWRGGYGLLARRVGAARPLAALERRVLGIPVASWLVLEDLRPAPVAAFALERGELAADALADALTRLVIDLHRADVDHGDLKATHVFLPVRDGRTAPALIDLEGVRFRRSLADARRIAALAELNASLSDALPGALRCRSFRRYAAVLPFAGGNAAALAEVARASLARRHRWTGAGCASSSRAPARQSH
jgi:tRNA A-37 threonylcarbamoyl transferase component Bud32